MPICNITKLLLVLVLSVGKVAADAMTVISAPLTTGLPTVVVEGCEQESKYFKFSTGQKLYGYMEIQNGTYLRLFNQQGQLAASINNLTAGAYKGSFQFLDSLQVIFALYRPTTWYRYVIQDNSGSLSMAYGFSLSFGSVASTATYIDPTSGYLYFSGSQDYKKSYRVRELSNFTGRTQSPDFVTNQGWGRTILPMLPADEYVLFGGDMDVHLVVTKVNMTLFGSVSNTINGVMYYALSTQLNNLNPIEYYLSSNISKIRRLSLNQATLTFTESTPMITLAGSTVCSLLNMGTLQYLASTSDVEIGLKIISKSSFLVSKTVVFPDSRTSHYMSLTGFEFDGSKAYFGRLENTNKNFQSYYLVFDNCTYRTATGVCTDCLSGYYRNTTAANGDCILPTDFPPLYGINSALILMAPCNDTHCTTCLNNYAQCNVCSVGTGFYLYSDSKCYDSSTAPAGYGIDTATGTFKPCSTGCTTCAANYQVCTVCNTPGGYFLHLPDAKCYNTANMPAGYGKNTVNGQTAVCQDVNCNLCANAYTVCTSCKTGSGWYLHSDAKCYNTASMPNGFGPNTGTGQTATCQDTHCLLCASLYTACTQCNTGAGWYLHSDTKCYNVATMPTGYGVKSATGTTSVCQTGNCQLCASVYTTCTQCLASFYLHSDNLCYSVATMPSGYGATGTGTTHACNEPNCVLCKADYMTCTSCNTGSGYYLHTDAKCYNVPSMPTGFGANTGTGLVASCSASQCQICSANYMACTICNANYYLHLNGNCYDVPGMPSGYGRNIANGSTTACQTTSCELCASAYTTCTKCLTNFYLHSDINCYSVATMPSGYGRNTASGTTTACQTTSCELCANAYTTCTKCLTNFYLHSDINCYSVATMPSGYGRNTASGTTTACSIPNCNTCSSDPSICTACKTVNGYYLHYDNSCRNVASMPAGFGANSGSGQTQACQIGVNCQSCAADYSVCTQCASTYYLHNTGACYLMASIPVGYGANTGNGHTAPCAAGAGCLSCNALYTTCSGCDSGSSFYMLTNQTCSTPANFPEGVGVVTSTATAVTCTTPNCANCKVDNTNCVACKTASGYYLHSDNTCRNSASMPSGYGTNTANGRTESCQAGVNCQSCAADYSVCTQCASTYYLHNTGACYLMASIPVGYGANTGNGHTAPCAAGAGCLSCNALYTTCSGCDSGSSFYMLANQTCSTPANFPEGVGVVTSTATAVTCTTPNCANCKVDNTNCVACKTASGYYLHSDNTCRNSASMPSGYGANTANGRTESCQGGVSCLLCTGDYSVCSQCASTYYLHNTGACYLMASIPVGYGANTANGHTAPCAAGAGCLSCNALYTTCSGCDSGSSFYMLANQTCSTPANFPEGVGVVTSTATAVTCTTPNCANCKVDNTNCVACKTASGYYLHSDNTCRNSGSMPSGYGANTANGRTESCQAGVNCQSCTADYSICTQCASTYYLHSNGVCYLAGSIPVGYGANTGNGHTAACSGGAGCLSCSADYSICSGCDSGSNFYMLPNQTCNTPANFPLGMGVVVSTATASACTMTDCDDCKVDNSICSECKTSNGYYLASNGSCVSWTNLPSGLGANVLTGTVDSCKDSSCDDCKKDTNTCLSCILSSPIQLYAVNGSCMALPSNYGVIPGGVLAALPCSDSHCVNCDANYLNCTECDTANGYLTNNGVCSKKTSNLIAMISAKFSSQQQKATITFSTAISTVTLDNITIIIASDLGDQEITCSATTCSLQTVGKTLQINLHFSTKIVKGQLSIRKKIDGGILSAPQDAELPDQEYPIEIENVYVSNSNGDDLMKMINTSSTALTTGRTVMNVVAIGFNPSSAMGINKLLANFMYLQLLGGPYLVYPNLLFDSVNGLNLMPFGLGNFFESVSDSGNCKLGEPYVKASVECNFLSNQGPELSATLITLSINIVISLAMMAAIWFVMKRAKKEQPGKSQTYQHLEQGATIDKLPQSPIESPVTPVPRFVGLLEFVKNNYGVRFFFIQMKSEVIEMMLFIFPNLFNFKFEGDMWAGWLTSIIFLGFYGSVATIVAKLILKINRDPDVKAAQIIPAAVKPKPVIANVVDLNSFKFGKFFDFFFDNITVGSGLSSLMFILADLVRSVLIGLGLLVLVDWPLVQCSYALVLELGYVYYILKSNVIHHKYEKYFEATVYIGHAIYVILKIITILDMGEITRQSKIGMGMAVLLLALVAAEIVFAFGIISFILVQIVKPMIHAMCTKKKKSTINNPEPGSPRKKAALVKERWQMIRLTSKAKPTTARGDLTRESTMGQTSAPSSPRQLRMPSNFEPGSATTKNVHSPFMRKGKFLRGATSKYIQDNKNTPLSRSETKKGTRNFDIQPEESNEILPELRDSRSVLFSPKLEAKAPLSAGLKQQNNLASPGPFRQNSNSNASPFRQNYFSTPKKGIINKLTFRQFSKKVMNYPYANSPNESQFAENSQTKNTQIQHSSSPQSILVTPAGRPRLFAQKLTINKFNSKKESERERSSFSGRSQPNEFN